MITPLPHARERASHGDDDLGLVIVHECRDDDLARIHLPALGNDLVEIGVRCIRRQRHIRRISIEQMLDLLTED
jgi:hypothetical protein